MKKLQRILVEKKKQSFYMEGNNGGDFILLEQRGDNKLFLKIAQSCVIMFEAFIPVEFLTIVLTQAVMNTNTDLMGKEYKDLPEAMMHFYGRGNLKWTEQLIKKIKTYNTVRPRKIKEPEIKEFIRFMSDEDS